MLWSRPCADTYELSQHLLQCTERNESLEMQAMQTLLDICISENPAYTLVDVANAAATVVVDKIASKYHEEMVQDGAFMETFGTSAIDAKAQGRWKHSALILESVTLMSHCMHPRCNERMTTMAHGFPRWIDTWLASSTWRTAGVLWDVGARLAEQWWPMNIGRVLMHAALLHDLGMTLDCTQIQELLAGRQLRTYANIRNKWNETYVTCK